jgi:hypothetical protein
MNLDKLGKIQRVEAPTYLFTRIQQKVENEKRERLSPRMAWILNLSLAVVIFMNAIVFIGSDSRLASVESYAESIRLTSENNLYK